MSTLGARIRLLRRARGFKTTRELAALLEGTRITESVLENIEAGRKSDPALSDLLNIAWVLRVPPSLLLVDLSSRSGVDLPNLVDDLSSLTAAEFDAWVSGIGNGAYRANSSDQRTDITTLEAFRELEQLRRELQRHRSVASLDGSPSSDRMRVLESEAARVSEFLSSAGWDPGSKD